MHRLPLLLLNGSTGGAYARLRAVRLISARSRAASGQSRVNLGSVSGQDLGSISGELRLLLGAKDGAAKDVFSLVDEPAVLGAMLPPGSRLELQVGFGGDCTGVREIARDYMRLEEITAAARGGEGAAAAPRPRRRRGALGAGGGGGGARRMAARERCV